MNDCVHLLDPEWCATCRGTPDPFDVKEPPRLGKVAARTEAKFSGTCFACGEPIQARRYMNKTEIPGDTLAKCDEKWVHEECAMDC